MTSYETKSPTVPPNTNKLIINTISPMHQ